MRSIEFLIAWDDRTWTTEIHEVPTEEEDPENGVDFDQGKGLDEDLVDWALHELAQLDKYRKAVMWAVYCAEDEDSSARHNAGG
jgi:hypothetical protein